MITIPKCVLCGAGGGYRYSGGGGLVVVVVVVVLIWHWWWWWGIGFGSGGDSHCKGGRYNSCESAVVGCMICCEYFGEGGSDYGGGSGIGGIGGK